MSIKHYRTPLLYCLFFSALYGDAFEDNEIRNRQRDILENLEKDPTKNIEKFDPQKPLLLQPQANEQCFNITNIDVNGVTLIDTSSINKVKQKYLNRCDTLTDLKNLTNELNALYIDKGYITSQFYLSPQNIAEGSLILQAVEGKIGKILSSRADIELASVSSSNDYLNIRDIETLLENINRLPSNHATMKLNPSETAVGYTDIVIENTPTRWFGGYVGVDNYGGKETGKYQINGRLNLDSLIGINDQLNIFYNTSDHRFEDEKSIGRGVAYSFPVGKTTFSLSKRNSSFIQYIHTGASAFASSGYTKSYSFDVNYKLYHNQKHRMNLGASISSHDTENYFADVYLQTSSYRLSKLSAFLDHTYQLPGFYTYINFSYTRGVDLFYNHHSTALDDEYSIFNFSFSAMKYFDPLKYSISAYAQVTNDYLFSADKIGIGGPYSVRGFQKEGLSGNQGYYVRNELSYNHDFNFLGGITNSYFVALDGGSIKSDEESIGGKLLGSSVGLKIYGNHFEASLHYDIPLYKKDVIETQRFLGVSIKAKF